MLYVDYLFVNDYNSDERRTYAMLIAETSLTLSKIECIANDILNKLDSSRELNKAVRFYFIVISEDKNNAMLNMHAVKANKNDMKRAYSNATRRLNRLMCREYERETSKAYTISACKNAIRFSHRARDVESLSDEEQRDVQQAYNYAQAYERNVSFERVTTEQRKLHDLCLNTHITKL